MGSASWLYPAKFRADPPYVPPLWVVLCVIATGYVWYLLAIWLGQGGQWWSLATVAALVFASYGLAFVFRHWFDHLSAGEIFNWATQYRSFLFDPGIAAATGVAAWALRRLYPAGGWFTSWWWVMAAYALGMAVGLAIRLALDYVAYEKAGALPLIYGLAKLIHDWWTWPNLAGALVYFGVPLVLAHRWSNSWWWAAVAVVVLAVAVWLTIGSGHDDKLDVRKVSTATNYGTWKPVPDQSLTSG